MTNRSMLLTSALRSVTFKAADETGTDKVIDKMVYLKAEDTLKDVVLHLTNVADAQLRLIAGMVVHSAVRAYSPVIADRAKPDDVREELMTTIREHAAMKRGYDFKRAWTYKLVQIAGKVIKSLMTDYDKKGVQEGSPLQAVLRSKSVDKACETVVEFMTAKTKGATSFAVLEKVYNPPVTNSGTGANAGKAGKRGNTGSTGNAVKASSVATAITGAKATEAFNAVEAKTPKARAIKIADKLTQANVDYFTMAARFVAMMDKPEQLMELAELCTNRAKTIAIKTNKAANKTRRDTSESGAPPAAAAAQA